MKLIVTSVVLLICVSLSLQDREAVLQVIEMYHKSTKCFKPACFQESGVDPELSANLRKGQISEDRRLKCFLSCVYISSGTISAIDGKINMEIFRKQVPVKNEVVFNEIERLCNDRKSEDKCEAAFEFTACIFGVLMALENQSIKI